MQNSNPKPKTDCRSSYAECPPFENNMCDALTRASAGGAPHWRQPLDHTAPARRVIFRTGETLERVPVMCQGWAVTALTMSDGRRQITSILLPGDLVSSASIFGMPSPCSIEAVTDLHYRSFACADVKEALGREPRLLAMMSRIWADQAELADRVAVNLGRRSAAERVASLILRLSLRLAARGMMQGQTMDFPLRQHHIADVAGITVVHVGYVLAEFRRAGLVEINDRTLTIADPAGLRRIVAAPSSVFQRSGTSGGRYWRRRRARCGGATRRRRRSFQRSLFQCDQEAHAET
jgi:CRP-like cAMP-binding protein